MKKKLQKKNYKKINKKWIYEKILNFNFVMIYTIHKNLVLIKNHLNYLKDNAFLVSITDLVF